MSVSMSPNLGNGGDNIDSLPTDQHVPSHGEVKMVETLFKEHHSTIQKMLTGAKEFVFLFILFVIFCLPQLDNIIHKFVSITESPYILAVIKGVLFVIIYFLIKNLYLARKN